jgi:hypothetical protein
MAKLRHYEKVGVKGTTANTRYNRLMGWGLNADVRCNRVKGYSQKYTIVYTTNTRNIRRNIQYDYIFLCVLGASASLKIHSCTQPDFARYIRFHYNEG